MKEETDREIVEQLPYLNELMAAIRNINDAILQNKDAREAAENLLSDLPFEWVNSLKEKIDIERNKYNIIISTQNKFLGHGFTPSQKFSAQKAIIIAGNTYARNVKRIVISLLNEKNLLFKTRGKAEMGGLSLVALGEADVND